MFLAVFGAFLIPATQPIEMLLTRNVSSDPPPYFPVLVRSSQDKFVIERLRNLSAQSNPVLEISDSDLELISGDLRSLISADHSKYAYFKVLGKGARYTDVSLEVPAKGDF